MPTRKRQAATMPQAQVKGAASVLTPDVAAAQRLRDAGLLYNDTQRESERARNGEQLEQVIRRLYGIGGAELVKDEVAKVYKQLGVK